MMSRNVKKTPVCKDQATRSAKRQASKSVRRYTEQLSNGAFYKKVFCSWDISDYCFRKTLQQEIFQWETEGHLHRRQFTIDQVILNWKKDYQRK